MLKACCIYPRVRLVDRGGFKGSQPKLGEIDKKADSLFQYLKSPQFFLGALVMVLLEVV